MSLQASTSSVEKNSRRNFIYVNAEFQKIFKKLVDCVIFDGGCTLLLGPSGIGKTLMLHRVVDIMGSSIQSIYIDKVYLDFNDFTTDISEMLGLNVTPGQERTALENFFLTNESSVQPTAFYIDNVEQYSKKVFSQLLALIEIYNNNKNAPSVILTGRPELLKMCSDFSDSEFQKNLVNDYCEIHPLSDPEMEKYLYRRLQYMGFGEKVRLSDAAVSKLIHASKGIPGSINRLCEEAIETSIFPDTCVDEITDLLNEESASPELPPLADKQDGIEIPLEEFSSQEIKEENRYEPELARESGLDSKNTGDHSSTIAAYIAQHYSSEKSAIGDDIEILSSNGESTNAEEKDTSEVRRTTGETKAALDLGTKKLEDVLASVYDSKRFSSSSSSSVLKSQNAGQLGIEELEEPEGVIADAGDAKLDRTESREDIPSFEEQVETGDEQKFVSPGLESVDEDSVEQFSRKSEVIDVSPVEKSGFLNGLLWLLVALVLFAAAGYLGNQYIKTKENKSERLVNSPTGGENIESKSTEEKQSFSPTQTESIQPSVDLPVTENAELLEGAKGRDKNLAEKIISKRDKKSVEGVLPFKKEKDPAFATEAEFMRMNVLEKKKENDRSQHSILIDASKKGYTQAIDKLLEFGHNVNYQSEYGDTALIWAVVNGHLDAVQVLLEHGADFSITNKLGVTAMSSAIHAGNIPIIETLLNAGANPHSTDEKNRTTLMVVAAQKKGNNQLVERLLLLGVNVDAVSQNGRTALMNAAENGNEDFIRILLKNHADVTMTEKNGDSAAEIANKAGFGHLSTLLDAPD
ncbi:MAG: ankyrin repeat domain-containing protein [Methylococcales bacterium]